jgi:hypothetical protein
MGKVLDLFSKEKPTEDKEIVDEKVIEETSFENIVETNRKKKEKLARERAQANIGVLKSYRIKQ